MSHSARSAKTPPPPKHAPYPAKNLGDKLKAPKSGEFITEHRWEGPKS